jgi:hypothetical protein
MRRPTQSGAARAGELAKIGEEDDVTIEMGVELDD